MSCDHHHHQCDCRHVGASQSLEEMDFERGIWYAAQHGDLSRVRTLLTAKGVDVDARDMAGYTAMHYASRHGKLDVCQLLLEYGADVNAVTKGGVSPLARAAMMGDLDIVKLLVRHKANPCLQDSDGKTALHRANENGHDGVCKFLLQAAPALKDISDSKGNKVEQVD